MRHPIDPTIDCVFKALLGSEDNRGLLIHFLNAILGPELPRPITGVEILNPYNEREFFSDKLSIPATPTATVCATSAAAASLIMVASPSSS